MRMNEDPAAVQNFSVPATFRDRDPLQYPRHDISAVLPDPAALEDLTWALDDLGVDESDVIVLYGRQGLERLEQCREADRKSGGIARLVHTLRDWIDRHDAHCAELRAGRYVVVVRGRSEAVDTVIPARIAACGGYFIHRCSRWTNRQLMP